MPDRESEMNSPNDTGPFADALKKLAPQPPHLSRDALLFLAGRAAASPRLPKWTWPSVAGGCATLALVLAAFLAAPGDTEVTYKERVVYVNNTPEAPRADHADAVPEVAPIEPKAKSSPDYSQTARMLKQRNEVLRWGVDMLPESKSNSDVQSHDATVRELQLRHELGLPAGTFAIPMHQPKKPTKEEDDE
jgi:hypothetical protein